MSDPSWHDVEDADRHAAEAAQHAAWVAEHPTLAQVVRERDELRVEVEALRAGRCLSDISHRDDGHSMSVCILPEDHTTAHDDGLGCEWTDAEHYGPSEVEALRATVSRVEEALAQVDPAKSAWIMTSAVRAALDDEGDSPAPRRGLDVIASFIHSRETCGECGHRRKDHDGQGDSCRRYDEPCDCPAFVPALDGEGGA